MRTINPLLTMLACALSATAALAAPSPQSTVADDGLNRAERAGTVSAQARSVSIAASALARAARARAERDPLAMLVAASELRAVTLVSGSPDLMPLEPAARILVPGLVAVQQATLVRRSERADSSTIARIDALEAALKAETPSRAVQSSAATPEPEPRAGANESSSAVPTSDSLFAEARVLARGDRELIARIDRARSGQSKGLTEQVPAFIRMIPGGSKFEWRVTAQGGAVWTVSAVGDGIADVDIGIFDERGRPVCSDSAVSHMASCSLTPRFTGQFTVVIANESQVATRAIVVSN